MTATAGWAGLLALATQPDDLSSVPGSHMVQRANSWTLYVSCSMQVPTLHTPWTNTTETGWEMAQQLRMLAALVEDPWFPVPILGSSQLPVTL